MPIDSLATNAVATDTPADQGWTPRGLTIRQRFTLVVFSVVTPMLLLSVAIVWQLADRDRETSRQAIMYASRSIMSAVDAQLGTQIAVGRALAVSPTLQVGDLAAFRQEAVRAMAGLPGAWVALADPQGRQVVNTLAPADATLPRIAPPIEASEARAFATRQVQIPDLVIGPVAKRPVVGVGVPVFRGSEPAYYLLIAVYADAFRDLLHDRRLPDGWLAGIIDRSGNFVARSLDHERWVGKPASAGWRAVKNIEEVSEINTVEGRLVVNATSTSPMSGWAVGVATEKIVLDERMWRTMAIVGVASLVVSLLSGLLANWIAGRIAAPIRALEKGAELLERGERVSLHATGVPEIDRALHAFDSAATKLIARERELTTVQTELWHVSRLSEMGQIAAALAHELNQPLTAQSLYIGGCQRILTADGIDDVRKQKLKQLMQQINEQALRAGEIIKQLRTFIQKGEGERKLETAAGVMREAATLAMTAARHKGVLVRSEIGEPGQVLVNKVQIQQVVFNLVRNAVEAMEASPRKELDIKLRASGGNIEMSVADTGAGLAPEIAARLFKPFSSTKSQGMGIGLSVCRDIVEAHQGRIWAEPNPGGGTVFRFTLPLVTEETAEEVA